MNHRKIFYTQRPGYMVKSIAFVMITGFLLISNNSLSQNYSWQEPHAIVSQTGDLEWAPESFHYTPGSEVRYIDYENGDDASDGMDTNTAWKHHPWDARATGNAAVASGVYTYVFKRGVTYRIFEASGASNNSFLIADEPGRADEPIRLTSSPAWGAGEAVIAGAIDIPSNWQKAAINDVPAGMDTTGVWYISVSGWYPGHPDWGGDIAETVLFEVTGGKTKDLHLACDPNWQEPGANFASDYWYRWEGWTKIQDMDTLCNPVPDGEGGYKTSNRAFDNRLAGFPCDYFDGGTLWSHWGSFMGTPTAKVIQQGDYNPVEGALKPNQTPIQPGTRYMVENLPQLLDTANEFYYDNAKKTLYLRLSGNRNPNETTIEMASAYPSLEIANQSHIHISGLTFTRNGFNKNVMWQDSKSTILVEGNCSDIVIKNCNFHYISNNALEFKCKTGTDVMDSISITDNDFFEVKSSAIKISGRSGNKDGGDLRHVDVLRNRVQQTGFRHNGHQWSNVAAVSIGYPNTAEIAGNIILRSFGSGLVVQGGKGGGTDGNYPGFSVPFTRILTHHNKIEHAALGVNDYGGLALWQGGPQYCYSNITGNAVGHLPGGLFNTGTTNLSYPLYLDGGFKLYNFNNIIWGRKYDPSDPYTSVRSAYFNVFGYMNQFINNTIIGTGSGFGGTSGNRNDMHGNLLANITKKFISSNHGGNPSLIGGGDDAASGIDGAGTLAYTNNLFHGDAIAGTLVTTDRGAEKDIESDAISIMSGQMQNYPLRCGRLGNDVGDDLPIRQSLPKADNPSASQADFRPSASSAAVNNGVHYFIPWSLYATVGEWHFNQNNRNPGQILDYHFYMTEAYFQRKTYYKLPAFELTVMDTAIPGDYVLSPSEDWTAGALLFDGTRYAVCTHVKMTDDIRLNINDWWGGNDKDLPPAPWTYPAPGGGYDGNGNPIFGDDQVMTYPGAERKTLDIDTTNMLIEVIFRADSLNETENTIIAGKHDGNAGYRLFLTPSGNITFQVSSGGTDYSVSTSATYNDKQWHDVLAEVDRNTGNMSIYADGSLSNENAVSIPSDASLSNTSDFIVGKDATQDVYFYGAVDFLRVCQGTLADALTTIEELYEWQVNGPVKHDFAGNAPQGKRDVGALEAVSEDAVDIPEMLQAWDFYGEGDTNMSNADYYHEAISVNAPGGFLKMGTGLSPTSWSWPDGFTFQHHELTLENAIIADDYIEFSILPRAGKILNITGITMNMMNSNKSATRQYALFSNRVPYAAGNEIASDTLICYGTESISLTGFNDITDTLSFRIYYFGEDGGLGGIYGNNGYDLLIQGNVKEMFKVHVQDSIHKYLVKSYSDDPVMADAEITNGGTSLHIYGNGYKKIEMAYDVTPQTVLEFEYSSTDQGSIQGIMFDDDNIIQTGDEENAVQVYGTSDWAKRPGIFYPGSGTKHFTIQVGQYFTGSFSNLVFMAKDLNMQLQYQEISNVEIFEDTTIGIPEATAENRTVVVWPNPCADVVHIHSDKPMDQINIVNGVTGKVVKLKHDVENTCANLSVEELDPGVYIILVYDQKGNREMVKMIKTE